MHQSHIVLLLLCYCLLDVASARGPDSTALQPDTVSNDDLQKTAALNDELMKVLDARLSKLEALTAANPANDDSNNNNDNNQPPQASAQLPNSETNAVQNAQEAANQMIISAHNAMSNAGSVASPTDNSNNNGLPGFGPLETKDTIPEAQLPWQMIKDENRERANIPLDPNLSTDDAVLARTMPIVNHAKDVLDAIKEKIPKVCSEPTCGGK